MLKIDEDLSDWLELSQDWEQSGLSQQEYCKSKGLSHSTFAQSRSKLMMKGLTKPCYKRSKCGKSPQAMRFLAVHIPTESISPRLVNTPEEDPRFIEVKLPHGIVIRIPTC